MKKVLIIGVSFFGYTLSVERAFQNLGYDTKVAIYKPQVSSYWEKIEYHLSRNKQHFREKTIPQRFNQKIFKLYKVYQPDMVFVFQELPLFKETLERMNKSVRVIWLMDSIFRKRAIYDIKDATDYLFLFERTDIAKLAKEQKKPAHFLPCALDETVYFPMENKKEIDILFIGHIYPNRMELLRKVCDNFKGKVIKFYGRIDNAVKEANKTYLEAHKDIFLDRNVTPAETNELYSRSKICFNVHAQQSFHGANQRFFEISGSKAFQLVDNNDYIQSNFSTDEIMAYQSEKDLFEKLAYALAHEKETVQLVQKAHAKVMKGHTFTHRIQRVLDVIEENPITC